MLQLPLPTALSPRPRRVAVVGAGPGGLVAARELRDAGLSVVCFEAAASLGGVWRQDVDGSGPLYRSLRTNLPRRLMAYQSFPWETDFGADEREFVCADAVRAYVGAFSDAFALRGLVRLSTRVTSAEPVGGGWLVRTVRSRPAPCDVEESSEERFDALVVAHGHYDEPRLPPPSVCAGFDGAVLHSRAYRDPAPFAGRTVLVLGASNSGEDIARDLAPVAARVLLSAATFQTAGDVAPRHANVLKRPPLARLSAGGCAAFVDGSADAGVDACIFCTGYTLSFPFLAPGVMAVSDNYAPLFEHVWPPDPSLPPLAFVGLPWRVAPFPLMELQAGWVASVLCGAAALPPPAAMARTVAAAAERLQPAGGPVPLRHAHAMDADEQFGYCDRLAAAVGRAPPPPWRKAMYLRCSALRRAYPEDYRDRWGGGDGAPEPQPA